MRAVAGRERVDAGLLRVTHLPGEYQVADLGTKPLGRPRIVQLLGLLNIRPAGAEGSEVASARGLSRGMCSDLYTSTGESAKLLAGLALLALVPRAKGQPDHHELQEGREWLFWVLAWLVTGVCVFATGWFYSAVGVQGGLWCWMQGSVVEETTEIREAEPVESPVFSVVEETTEIREAEPVESPVLGCPVSSGVEER